MGEELPPAGRTRQVLSFPEKYVPTRGEGHGLNRSVQRIRFGVGVYTHIAEVCVKKAFHRHARPTV
jgi:hypothetical protein